MRVLIWGILSHTAHLPSGFNPTVAVNDHTVEEHQFLASAAAFTSE